MFRRRIDWKANLLGLIALGVVFAAFEVFPTAETKALEETVFDQYQRWKPRPYQKEDPDNPGELLPAPPVLVVDIDEQSLEEMGQCRHFRNDVPEGRKPQPNALSLAEKKFEVELVEEPVQLPGADVSCIGTRVVHAQASRCTCI